MIFRTQKPVPAEEITEVMFRANPVWEFCNEDESGETLLMPAKKLPITSSENRLVGCELRLRDGSTIFWYLGNLDLTKAFRNQHFLTLSIFMNGTTEHLARYHDLDFSDRGPAALAQKIGKNLEDIFPMTYDLSACATGSDDCIRGSIQKEPKERLSRSEIIMLAVNG